MKVRTVLLRATLTLGLVATAQAQQFVEGMRLFNQAKYDSLIHIFVPQFINQYPNEEGLARFFLAESFYNKGVSEPEAPQAINFFQRAYAEFEAALTFEEIRAKYSEYYFGAQYMLGWCSYRLAELGHEPDAMLQQAYTHFGGMQADAPDSVRLFSLYMAGKAGTRSSLLQLRDPRSVIADSSALRQQVGHLTEIVRLYDGILEEEATGPNSTHYPELVAMVRFESLSVQFLIGKWYQLFSTQRAARYANLDDLQNLANKARTSFEQVIESVDSGGPSGVSLRGYYRLMAWLNNYMLFGHNSVKQSALGEWSNLTAAEFEAEKAFRRANLHHSNPDVTGGDFNELASRYYYDAATEIAESYYWRGYLQMIQNDSKNSRDNFQRFLQGRDDDSLVTPREQTLYEDAQLRKFLLEFEVMYLSSRFKQLRVLASDIQAFSPVNVEIQKRKALVNLIVHCSLIRNPSQLWSDVLTGTDDEKLSQALETITFILPRAALNIGSTREKYLTLLGRLFEVTKSRRSDETLFFRGIAKSLEAEIQASPVEKSRIYLEAARILKAVRSGYVNKDEAEYLRARCLFFADEFEEADALLRTLVSNKHSLRALFYLAETYRYNGQGLAAKKCYQAIVDKSRNAIQEFDKYWLLNAKAGLQASNDEGDLTALAGINIDGVRFQSDVKEHRLAYEKLADERFLQQQLARESVEWLMQYGLPKKEFYPSKHRIANSFFVAANIFESAPWTLDEVRGPVTSTLRLLVAEPSNGKGKTTVKLGNQTIPSSDGIYLTRKLPLNSEHDLAVSNSQSYDHINKVKLTNAGENLIVAVLSKRINFSPSSDVKNIFNETDYPFQERWDRNVIFNDPIPEQTPDSELVKDFSSLYELRDCAVDKSQNRILAVHALEKSIRVYSAESSSKRIGDLHLDLPSSLSSPEGIAVDSKGRVWIADWGNHRVLKVDSNGKWLQVFGSFGTNDVTRRHIKFTFPTRVAILEDLIGTEIGEATYYREDYLIVADHNGIHVSDMKGNYLHTVLHPTDSAGPGSLYGFRITGHDDRSRLFLVKRDQGRYTGILEFIPH